MTARRIVVWRHGRTEWNATGRFQGQADIGLDERGHHQAKRIAPVLAAMVPSRILASDLLRAIQTAEPLSELTGLPIEKDPRLREIHVGSWEGLTWEEISLLDPEPAAGLRRGEDVRRSATGETVAEVAARVVTAFDDLAESAEDDATVIAVMHGLAARVGAAHFVGLPQGWWNRLGGMHNCGWIILERHRAGGFWRIEEYNVAGKSEVRDPID